MNEILSKILFFIKNNFVCSNVIQLVNTIEFILFKFWVGNSYLLNLSFLNETDKYVIKNNF